MHRFAANLTMLFNEVEFLDRFELAAKAGFKGVEFLFPYEWPPHKIKARLNQFGLQQVLFNLPPGNWNASERGIACHPDRKEEFKAGVKIAIEYAQELNCSQLNCLAGIKPTTVSDAQAWQTLKENLSFAAQQLDAAGIILMVEAINSRIDMPGFFLDCSEKIARIIKEVAMPNVRYQFDIYHMQIMEGDLIRNLQTYREIIGHIQFADNPGRHEPGTGEIQHHNVFRALDEIGYKGWISAEYKPSTTTEASLSWLDQYKH